MTALAAVVGMALASCGSADGQPSTPEPGSPAEISRSAAEAAVLGLCETLLVSKSNPEAAETAFYDRSHDRLHIIAALLEDVDRTATARLLESKLRVESSFDIEPPPPGLATQVEELLAATRRALALLSVPAPDCPQVEGG